ncbi:MAG: glycosyltransferase [Erythrobacter sp.]
MAPHDATIVIVPRERFGSAVESLESVVKLTARPYALVYIDCASPKHIAAQIKLICERHGFSYYRFEEVLSPNAARNTGLRKVSTPYVVFLDNDVIVSEGWLEALLSCARETGAEVVAPLTCQKEPLHSEIHQAGGEFAADHRAFLAAPPEDRRITDVHVLQGAKVMDVTLKRAETQCCEFHCALVRTDVFARIGELDERLLATKEHIDFCMTVWASGGTVLFEPESVVTYLFPGRNNPLIRGDRKFFALRWSPQWQQKSLDHFQAKWSLHRDPYFERRRHQLTWRLTEGIGKPLLSRVPFVHRSHRLRTFALKVLTAALTKWSDRLVRTHRSPARNSHMSNGSNPAR